MREASRQNLFCGGGVIDCMTESCGTECINVLLKSVPFLFSVEEAQELKQECHISQSLSRELVPPQTYQMRAQHELRCTHAPSVNHKVRIQ